MTAAKMTNKNVTCRSFPLFSSGLPASTLWRRSCCCCSYWWIGCCCDDCWPDFFPSLHFHLPRRGSVGKRELQNRHEPNRCFRPLEKGMAWVVQWEWYSENLIYRTEEKWKQQSIMHQPLAVPTMQRCGNTKQRPSQFVVCMSNGSNATISSFF